LPRAGALTADDAAGRESNLGGRTAVIPGEAIGWTEFDVLARDAAVAAHVAMWLREALPGAFLRSEPDPAPSGDELRPHLLHCSARIGESSGEDTRRMLDGALTRLAAIVGAEPRARVVFSGDAARPARRAA
jgi:hypothetical protein